MWHKRRQSQQLARTSGLWVPESDKMKAYHIGVELLCMLSGFSEKGL